MNSIDPSAAPALQWYLLHGGARMAWNSGLALIPWGLSWVLFRGPSQIPRPGSTRFMGQLLGQRWLWGFGCLIFILFLPNAPYILTDVIHLWEDLQLLLTGTVAHPFSMLAYHRVFLATAVSVGQAIAHLAQQPLMLIVLLKYGAFLSLGLGAYVGSLRNLSHYLGDRHLTQWVAPAQQLLHLLCAIGIYLGRVDRFNSWDTLTQPQSLILGVLRNFSQTSFYVWILSATGAIAVTYYLCEMLWGTLTQKISPRKSPPENLPQAK
jgi:uncharacterized membrane protein